jgi:hypothetical protein
LFDGAFLPDVKHSSGVGTILPSFSTLLPLQGEGSPLIYGPILSWLLLDRGESAAQSGEFPDMVFLRESFQNDPL